MDSLYSLLTGKKFSELYMSCMQNSKSYGSCTKNIPQLMILVFNTKILWLMVLASHKARVLVFYTAFFIQNKMLNLIRNSVQYIQSRKSISSADNYFFVQRRISRLSKIWCQKFRLNLLHENCLKKYWCTNKPEDRWDSQVKTYFLKISFMY